METKLFELRDRATFVPVIATRLSPRNEQEAYLLGRSGYPDKGPGGDHFVLLTGLNSPDKSTYDPYDWGNRTRVTAHQHIVENWDKLKSGDVIDVEFILGETMVPKKSERFYDPLANAPYIQCPKCGKVSHHPKDIAEKYCGSCHQFHADMEVPSV